jgi:transposase
MLLADRGYDADWIRALAAKKGAWANIPSRCNRNEPICFSPYLYRARNLVERFFKKIKIRKNPEEAQKMVRAE